VRNSGSELNPAQPVPTEWDLRELEKHDWEFGQYRKAERTIKRLRAEVKRLKSKLALRPPSS
jgi:hypothetical protein